MATSRRALDVPGEVVWRVPSMALPVGELPPVDALVEYDAVRLFCDRAARARSDFVLGTDNAETVTTICRLVDGIPLAIELAAARVRSMHLDEIRGGLDDRFRLIVRNFGGDDFITGIVPAHDATLAERRRIFIERGISFARFLMDKDRSALCVGSTGWNGLIWEENQRLPRRRPAQTVTTRIGVRRSRDHDFMIGGCSAARVLRDSCR